MVRQRMTNSAREREIHTNQTSEDDLKTRKIYNITVDKAKKTSPLLTTDDGTIITSSKEKAEVLAKSFATNSTLSPPTNLELPYARSPQIKKYQIHTVK